MLPSLDLVMATDGAQWQILNRSKPLHRKLNSTLKKQ